MEVFEKLQRQYPHIQSRLLTTGESPYPSAKVYSLNFMLAAAKNDLVVMTGSDSRVMSSILSTVAAEFKNSRLAIATCPICATISCTACAGFGAPSIPDRLATLGSCLPCLSRRHGCGVLCSRSGDRLCLAFWPFARLPSMLVRRAVRKTQLAPTAAGRPYQLLRMDRRFLWEFYRLARQEIPALPGGTIRASCPSRQ